MTCQATAMTTNESTANNEFRLGKDGHKSLQDASSEQALIAAAQAGISDAMDELLVRHRRCVYRAARRFTQTHEEAEDLVQDAMLRAFVNVGKFRHESHFATWVIAIVNNAGLSMKRKGKGAYWLSLDSRKDESSSLSGWDVPDGRLNPEQEIVQQELLAILQKVLLRQSRMHRPSWNSVSSTKPELAKLLPLSDSPLVQQNRVSTVLDAGCSILSSNAGLLRDAISQA